MKCQITSKFPDGPCVGEGSIQSKSSALGHLAIDVNCNLGWASQLSGNFNSFISLNVFLLLWMKSLILLQINLNLFLCQSIGNSSEFIWIPVLSFFATLLSCYIPCFRSCPDQHLHLAYLVLSYLLLLDSMELDVTLTRHPQAQNVGGLSVEDLRSSVMCQPFDKTRQIRS